MGRSFTGDVYKDVFQICWFSQVGDVSKEVLGIILLLTLSSSVDTALQNAVQAAQLVWVAFGQIIDHVVDGGITIVV